MKTAPDYVKPLLGIREWDIYTDGCLYSTTVEHLWETRTQEKAVCHFECFGFEGDEHEAPLENCYCGMYAFYNLSCQKEFGSWIEGYNSCRGIVSGWGKIILHEYGFRAEYMKIEAIIWQRLPYNIPNHWAFAQKVNPVELVASRYNVPLVSAREVGGFIESLDGLVFEPDPAPKIRYYHSGLELRRG